MSKPSLINAKVLVVGGAGYVGSATVAWLIDQGHEVWVIDDLSTGRSELLLVPDRFLRARAGDEALVLPFLQEHQFDVVLYFAAFTQVAESVTLRDSYFENNVQQTRQFIEAYCKAGGRHFVFSSTCAVFGVLNEKDAAHIHEQLPKNPTNPYAETKLEVEKLLEAYAQTHELHSIALRYFNAAGAESQTRVGEWHSPESHLIPNVFKAAVTGQPLQLFGSDYSTADGTCVRDYVHVTDLARAHESALLRLLSKKERNLFEVFNCGSEQGYSVLQVIQMCEHVTGKSIPVQMQARRSGDVPRLVADSNVARDVLGFRCEHSLLSIVQSAWAWEQKKAQYQGVIFLDRDGTINIDPGYISAPDLLQLMPGAAEGLALLKKNNYRFAVVTNQSGVARGYIHPNVLTEIHRHLDHLLFTHSQEKVTINHYELCVHHPDEGCACRKPKPLLLLNAARKLGAVDMRRSVMIGDKWGDVLAGKNAGVGRVILVRTGYGLDVEKSLKEKTEKPAFLPDFIADDLVQAAQWILKGDGKEDLNGTA